MTRLKTAILTQRNGLLITILMVYQVAYNYESHQTYGVGMIRFVSAGVAIATGVAALSACSPLLAQNSATVHFAVDVKIETDGQVHGGRSVWSYTIERAIVPLVSSYKISFRAEAITIPLGGDLYAFVLPVSATDYISGSQWFATTFTSGSDRADAVRISSFKRVASEIGRTRTISCLEDVDISKLARIKDDTYNCPIVLLSNKPADPQTFISSERAAGTLTRDKPKVVSLRLTIVDEPVTNNLEKLLPWLRLATKEGLKEKKNSALMSGLSREQQNLRYPLIR